MSKSYEGYEITILCGGHGYTQPMSPEDRSIVDAAVEKLGGSLRFDTEQAAVEAAKQLSQLAGVHSASVHYRANRECGHWYRRESEEEARARECAYEERMRRDKEKKVAREAKAKATREVKKQAALDKQGSK